MTEVDIIRKRFIAAAVCPACDEVDRIVIEVALQIFGGQADDTAEPAELSRRRCVACGFADEFAPAEQVGFQGLPKGRPERPKSVPVNPVKVRILDPKDPGL